MMEIFPIGVNIIYRGLVLGDPAVISFFSHRSEYHLLWLGIGWDSAMINDCFPLGEYHLPCWALGEFCNDKQLFPVGVINTYSGWTLGGILQ